MFHRAIDQVSPWTDRDLFENVQGGKYRQQNSGSDDNVMLATLRALLSRRLPEGMVFKSKVSRISVTDDVIENPVPALNHLASMYNSSEGDTIDNLNNMFVVAYATDIGDDKVAALVDNAQKKVLELPGWAIHEKQHKYLNQYMKMVALLNAERNVAIIVTSAPTMSNWHLLGSMIPAYFSQMFKEIELTAEEKDMLHSLTIHNSAPWLSKMAALEDLYNIREMKIQQMIGWFERREREAQASRIESELGNCRNSMEQIMRQYRDLCVKQDDLNIRLNGLKYAIDNAQADDELIKFFQLNKCLDVVGVDGTRITYIVRTYLESFGNEGSDRYEDFRQNDRFFEEMRVSRSEIFRTTENKRKFLDALIIDRKIKLKMCAIYHLDILGSVNTTSDYDYPNNCADYLPNYHLDHHACFGDYRRIICDYLNRGDTIGAIGASITSAKSINVEESGATFNPFMGKVFDSNKKCIVLPDGSSVTPAKAMEWLLEQEKQEVEE